MEEEFKIGDKVKCIHSYGYITRGMEGTIVKGCFDDNDLSNICSQWGNDVATYVPRSFIKKN